MLRTLKIVGVSLMTGIALVSCTPQTNAPVANTNAEVVVPRSITLSGAYDCLPHADTRGPQTMECAIGLKTAEGKYYALDMGGLSSEQTRGMASGTQITVEGMVTPIAMISSDRWRKYNVEGIMKVTSLKK